MVQGLVRSNRLDHGVSRSKLIVNHLLLSWLHVRKTFRLQIDRHLDLQIHCSTRKQPQTSFKRMISGPMPGQHDDNECL